MKNLFVIMVIILCGAGSAHADAYVKLMSDKVPSEVFVNNEFAGTVQDLPLEFILPPGEYVIEVKKENQDGSTGYFRRDLKVGKIDIKVPISAQLKPHFSEAYYYKKATTLKGAQIYLEKYPRGRWAQQVAIFLERETARNAKTIEGAKRYFEQYPDGRYTSAILDRDIFLLTQKTETRDGETRTWTYAHDAKGNLIRETYETGSGRSESTSYTYTGALLVKKVFQRKGKDPVFHSFHHDDQNRLIEEHIFRKDKLEYKIFYTYDDRGNRVEELKKRYLYGKYKRFMSYRYTYAYDKNSRLVEKYEEHLKNGDWKKTTYWYDDQGNMIKRRHQELGYRDFDKTYHYEVPEIVYHRDDAGRIRQEIENPDSATARIVTEYSYGPDGKLAEKNKRFTDGRRINYIYDANENLVEERFYPDSNGYTSKETWEYGPIKLKHIFGQQIGQKG